MAAPKLEDLTLETLSKQKKNLRAGLGVLAALFILYVGFFIYLLIMRQWNSTYMGGIVMLAVLGAISSSSLGRLRSIQREIQKRQS